MKPLVFTWDGEAMQIAHFHRADADKQFVIGQRYRLVEVDERSQASHNHFFATVHDVWSSLPDNLVERFQTEEVLRKHALIMTGFFRERRFAMESPAAARRLAATLKPIDLDEDYAIIAVNDCVVVERRPLSQSRKGMPEKGQFNRSKQAVLEWISGLVGVTPEDLPKASDPPSLQSKAA